MAQLTYRQISDEPPIYRVSIDGIEIGSIAERTRHLHPISSYWHWGVDVMPLMDHDAGHPAVISNHRAASKTR